MRTGRTEFILWIMGVILTLSGDAWADTPSRATVSRLVYLVNAAHDARAIPEEAPYLADKSLDPVWLGGLGRGECRVFAPSEQLAGSGTAPDRLEQCDLLVRLALNTELQERYFAADTEMFRSLCRADSFACLDPIVSELWLRKLHNIEIEKSRGEKLAKLEAWTLGRIPDEIIAKELRLPPGEFTAAMDLTGHHHLSAHRVER